MSVMLVFPGTAELCCVMQSHVTQVTYVILCKLKVKTFGLMKPGEKYKPCVPHTLKATLCICMTVVTKHQYLMPLK